MIPSGGELFVKDKSMTLMKWYFIPLAGVLGIMVGQWGPRERLRAIEEARSESASVKNNSRKTDFNDFTRLVNIPEVAKRPHVSRAGKTGVKPVGGKRAKTAADKGETRVAAANTNRQESVKTKVERRDDEAPATKLNPEDLRARIEEAQQLWATRVELARATWKEKLKLNGESADRFDVALDEMNVKLYDTISTFATLLAQKNEITPELGCKFMSDATAILGETYEALGAGMPADLRDAVSTMPIMDFIDPGVVEPMVEVQDKLRNFKGFGGGAR